MYKNLVELAKECPGLQVSFTLGDLVEANRLLIAEAKRELEQEIADSKAETYVSRAQACKSCARAQRPSGAGRSWVTWSLSPWALMIGTA